jgi:hypothetical protein
MRSLFLSTRHETLSLKNCFFSFCFGHNFHNNKEKTMRRSSRIREKKIQLADGEEERKEEQASDEEEHDEEEVDNADDDENEGEVERELRKEDGVEERAGREEVRDVDDDDDDAPEEISFTAAHSQAKEVEKLLTETQKSSKQQQKIARFGLSDRQKELVIDPASQPGAKAHVKKMLPDEVLRAMEDKLKRRDKEIREKRLMKKLQEQTSVQDEDIQEARADDWMGLEIQGLDVEKEKTRQANAAMKREGDIAAVHRDDFLEESIHERGKAMMARAEEFLSSTTRKPGKRVDALTFLSQKMKNTGPSLKFGLKNKRRKRS